MRWESLSAAAVQFSSDTQSALRVESFLCPRNQFSACYRSGFPGSVVASIDIPRVAPVVSTGFLAKGSPELLREVR